MTDSNQNLKGGSEKMLNVNVCKTWPAKIPHSPIITKMLKTAEPTMVPTPTSPLVMKTPEKETGS